MERYTRPSGENLYTAYIDEAEPASAPLTKLGCLEDILEKHGIDVDQLDKILTEHEKTKKDLDVLGIIKNEVPFHVDYDGGICISYDPDDDDCSCVYLNIDEEMRDKLKEWMGW